MTDNGTTQQPPVEGSADSPSGRDESVPRRERRLQRRLQQKREECLATFCKLEGLDDASRIFTHRPRKTLAILNAGYSGEKGVTGEQLEAVFRQFKGFERIVMLHGKPYSFAVYRGSDDADVVKEALSGKPCPELSGRVLFLESISHVDFAYICDRHCAAQGVVGRDVARLDEETGFFYIPDFISKGEQQEIMENIRVDEERERLGRNGDSKWFRVQDRYVKHYGHSFDYHRKHIGTPDLAASTEIPQWMNKFVKRAFELVPTVTKYPDQMTIQQYPVGSGIPFHTDSHTSFGDTVFILSLLTPVAMDFRHPTTRTVVTKDLEPCSFVVMQGETRYEWEHAIRIRRSDLINGEVRERQERWSITMRTFNETAECHCRYPALCDNDTEAVKKIREERLAARRALRSATS